jgi:hypothetical protein
MEGILFWGEIISCYKDTTFQASKQAPKITKISLEEAGFGEIGVWMRIKIQFFEFSPGFKRSGGGKDGLCHSKGGIQAGAEGRPGRFDMYE